MTLVRRFRRRQEAVATRCSARFPDTAHRRRVWAAMGRANLCITDVLGIPMMERIRAEGAP